MLPLLLTPSCALSVDPVLDAFLCELKFSVCTVGRFLCFVIGENLSGQRNIIRAQGELQSPVPKKGSIARAI